MGRMSDNTRLSGIAAKPLAGTSQRDGVKRSGLPVNRNFSSRALCNAVMDNGDILKRTTLELIGLYRSGAANIAHEVEGRDDAGC
jgi:hypothetical protein